MKFKRIIFLSLTLFAVLSCQPNNPAPNTPSTPFQISWQLNIGGTNYSWTGNYPDDSQPTSSANFGGSQLSKDGTLGNLNLTKSLNNSTVFTSVIPNFAVGSFNFTPTSYSTTSMVSFIDNNVLMYSNAFDGSDVTIEINSISPNTVTLNGQYGAGLVTGTISGTIGVNPSNGGGTKSISGTFSAVRIN
jgi:hypothetical protein